jgi:hypothetical protein
MSIVVNARDVAILSDTRTIQSSGYNAVTLVLLASNSLVSADSTGAVVMSAVTGITNTATLWVGNAAAVGAVYSVASPAASNGVTLSINSSTGVLTLTSTVVGGTWSTVSDSEVFTINAVYGGITYTTQYRITKVKGGAAGSGSTSISATLTNETATIGADTSGTVPTGGFAGATTMMVVFVGATDDSTNWTYACTYFNVTSSTLSSSRIQSITAMSADYGYIDIVASKATYPNITKRFIITKVRNGSIGTSPSSYWLLTSTAALKRNNSNAYTPTSLVISSMYQTGSSTPGVFSGIYKVYENGNATAITGAGAPPLTASASSYVYTPSSPSLTIIKIELYLADGTTKVDEQTIPIVTDGTSVYTLTIPVYQQLATTPTTPTGGLYTFTGDTLTVPTGLNPWYRIQPTGSQTPTWVSTATFQTGTPGTAVAPLASWTAPIKFVQDGAPGSGSSGISATLTNESATVGADSTGTVPTGGYDSAVTQMIIFEGITDTSVTWTYNSTYSNVTSSTAVDSRTQAISSMSADSGYILITASKSPNSPITKKFIVTKLRNGTAGTSPTSYWLVPGASAFSRSASGTYTPSVISISSNYQIGTNSPAAYPGVYKVYENGILLYTSAASEYTHVYTPFGSGLSTVTIELYLANGTTKVDSQTIPIVTNGTSVYTVSIPIYQQLAFPGPLTTPTGGTYTFTGDTLTAPTGWSRTQPSGSTTPTWISTATFQTGTPGTAVGPLIGWATPIKFVQDGAGGAGTSGQSNYRAYLAATYGGAVPTTPTTASTYPPTSSGGTVVWSASPLTLSTGQIQYQSDGTKAEGATTISWTTAYPSYFKVATLEALGVTTGTLNVDGGLTLGTNGYIKTSGSTGYGGTGLFLGYSSGDYKFSLGGASGLTYSGGLLTIPAAQITGIIPGGVTPPSTWLNSNININANGTLNNGSSGAISLGSLAGTLAIGQIGDGSITTGKLLVTGRGKALNDDPACMDSTAWIINVGSFAVQSDTTAPVGTKSIRVTSTGGGAAISTRSYPVEAGKTYKISCYLKQSGGGLLYIRHFSSTSAGTQSIISEVRNITGSPYYLESIASTLNVWQKWTGFQLIPANSSNAFIQLVLNWQAAGYTDICDVRCEEYISSDLIVDGSILAAKIDTRGLEVKATDGTVILSAGIPLTSTYITPPSTWLNSSINIVGGAINNIGTGAGTIIDNSAISITGGAISGINASSNGIVVANSAISLAANGTLSGAASGTQQVTISGLGYTGALNATANQSDAITNAAIDARLNKNSVDILSSTISLAAISGAGFRAGDLSWDASGNRIGGYGVAMTPGGITAYSVAGGQTFNLNATTGDATFGGTLTASNVITTDNIQINAVSKFYMVTAFSASANIVNTVSTIPISITFQPLYSATIPTELMYSGGLTINFNSVGVTSNTVISINIRLFDQYQSTIYDLMVLKLPLLNTTGISASYYIGIPPFIINNYGSQSRSTYVYVYYTLASGTTFPFGTITVSNASLCVHERRR